MWKKLKKNNDLKKDKENERDWYKLKYKFK